MVHYEVSYSRIAHKSVSGFPSFGSVMRNVQFTAEENSTPVAGGNDTVLGTANAYYTFFTMPSTYNLYKVTGFEWLNGTVVNGNVISVLVTPDANPPVANGYTVVAWCTAIIQAGASAVQRVSQVTSTVIESGTLVGAFLSTSSATARFGTTTKANANRLKAFGFTADPAMGSFTVPWAAGTEEPYIKVYYKGVS